MARRLAAARSGLDLSDDDFRGVLGAGVPLAGALSRWWRSAAEPRVVGISGAQGSGKSTLARIVQILLEERHGHRVARLSIDDVYLTRAERATLAREVHPLLATRGVPGTHDVALGRRVLSALTSPGGRDVALPRFDKAIDDRADPSTWPSVPAPVDLVLFEGWCVSVGPEPPDALATPLNALEAEEDPTGDWRGWVNARLDGPYRAWFADLDLTVFLRVPDFDHVRRWRALQEARLARRRPGAGGIMDPGRLDRFMMHYERITRHAQATLPARADVIADVGPTHRIERLESRSSRVPIG